MKWFIIAVGAVVSFIVIDYGRLKLEQFRATAENERELLDAYLDASGTIEPDLWLRKLELIRNLSTDMRLRAWANGEIAFLKDCAAKDIVYQDILRVASALLSPHDNSEQRMELCSKVGDGLIRRLGEVA